MQRSVSGSDCSDEQTIVQRLKREGAAARCEWSAPLCERIMQAVDQVQQQRSATFIADLSVAIRVQRNARPSSPKRRSKVALATITTAAASLLAGLGLLAWRTDNPPPQTAVQWTQPAPAMDVVSPGLAVTAPTDEPASSLFSTTAVAVASWTALSENADPLEELNHDAQLAGEMVLAAVPYADRLEN